MIKDLMNSASQIIEGVKESTGIDIQSVLSGFVAGKAAGSISDSSDIK